MEEVGTGEENMQLLSNVTVRKNNKSRRHATMKDTSTHAVTSNPAFVKPTLDSLVGSIPPATVDTVSIDANLPHGDGVKVSSNAGSNDASQPESFQEFLDANKVNANVPPSNPNAGSTVTHVSPLNTIKSKNDFIELVFGVSLKSSLDIDLLLKEIEAGKYPKWSNLDSATRSHVHDAMYGLFEAYEIERKANATTSNSGNSVKVPTPNGVNVDANPNTTVSALAIDSVCEGVNVSIPRRVVEKVSARLEYTLYGYFIGNRMAFPVVEYYVRNNWAKYGLKKIMMNAKGFFFFKFDTQAGLEAVLEDGPWLIRKSPIILKKWSIDTRLCKEELTRIPVWVKLHDVPIQVFEDDGISLIASFLGKPIMLDSYTSSICKDS